MIGVKLLFVGFVVLLSAWATPLFASSIPLNPTTDHTTLVCFIALIVSASALMVSGMVILLIGVCREPHQSNDGKWHE